MGKGFRFMELLSDYLTCYLPVTRGLSQNTARSYRHSFRLLLEFLHERFGVRPDKVGFADLQGGVIGEWLNWLEESRGCCVNTRNQRLAAMRAFARFAMLEAPDIALQFCIEVERIPRKKGGKPGEPVHLTKEEVSVILGTPDATSKVGRRDMVLLSTLYASGARAQEICDLTVADVRFGASTIVTLRGKGSKARSVVIPEQCAKLLRKHIDSLAAGNRRQDGGYVFSSQTRDHMTISCVEAMVRKYVGRAKAMRPELFSASYSPHSLRHSIAMHMLESGVPLPAIKAFLGHESINTTMIYASANQELVMKYLRDKDPYAAMTDSPADGSSSLQLPSFLL